jgi:hypothetical protein
MHPTPSATARIAQELINIRCPAGVQFRHENGQLRSGSVSVDCDRLIRRDAMIRQPPHSLAPGLEMLRWAEAMLYWADFVGLQPVGPVGPGI